MLTYYCQRIKSYLQQQSRFLLHANVLLHIFVKKFIDRREITCTFSTRVPWMSKYALSFLKFVKN